MKISRISIIAIIFVVIAVAIAGCSSTSPTTPTTGGTTAATPAATPAATTAASAPSGTTSSLSGGATSGSDLFGGLSYNWVEYKMSTGSGSDAMTIYYKYDKQTGKCTMRFEGAQAMQGLPTVMDCGSTGQAQSNPNQVSSDAQVSCSPIDESVTVPAGTFTATKCTVTSKGSTSTVWIVKNKFMVKMSASTPQGALDMVLNTYG